MSERAVSRRAGLVQAETAMALAVVAVIFMILVPLPTFLLDFFLALQLALALSILFLSLGIRKASDFSVFPTLLLLSTLLGLALNISSTRLILLKGSGFDGKLIRAFGSFVSGGGAEGIVVGSLIFVIIMAVQMIVITKGSGRVAEVAARFSLDALPGRQMAIEAELSSGSIDASEAVFRKAALREEADFYGQMDGASKFVSGNAKVAIFITLVDIIGGFIVGVSIHGEDFATAVETYTSLTIGDGLVSQLPALLISVAAGIVVTKADSGISFASQTRLQFGSRRGVFSATGAILAIMAFLPGFPWYVLLPLAAVFGYVGFGADRGTSPTSAEPSRDGSATGAVGTGPGPESGRPRGAEATSPPLSAAFSGALAISRGRESGIRAPTYSSVAQPDAFCLELGYGLVPLALAGTGSPGGTPDFIESVTALRAEASLETGVPIPPLRVLDSSHIGNYACALKIRGDRISGAVLKPGRLLASGPSAKFPESIRADAVKDPRNGKDAFWISAPNREKAESHGFTVTDHRQIILDLIMRSMRERSADFLGRQEVHAIMEDMRKEYPAVIASLVAAHTPGDVQRVLQILLREGVSIRNTVTIFETLADYPEQAKNHFFLAEKARQSLSRQIWLASLARTAGYRSRTQSVAVSDGSREDGEFLRVFTISFALARELAAGAVSTDSGPRPALEPARHEALLTDIACRLTESGIEAESAVLICPGHVRSLVRAATERRFPGLWVLSNEELPPEARIGTIAEIALPD